MGSIKQSAENYVAPTTKNIADLEVVSIDQEIVERTHKEGTPDEYKINVVVIDGDDHRVPDVVLKQLKGLVKAKPKMTAFKVTKEGTTKTNTTYQTIPMD